MTAKAKRWKVAQHILSKMWVTWNDEDMKENPIRLADRTVRAFRTHAEALAYADRMARKVQVTLPRPTEKFLAAYRSHIAEWLPLGDEPENPVVWTFVGAGHIYIQRIEPGDFKPHEARKVALALLAAANCAEEEQQ